MQISMEEIMLNYTPLPSLTTISESWLEELERDLHNDPKVFKPVGVYLNEDLEFKFGMSQATQLKLATENPEITKYELFGCKFTYDSLGALKEFLSGKTIEELNLTNTSLTNTEVNYLFSGSDIKVEKWLGLGTNDITTESINVLLENKVLGEGCRVEVGYTNISQDDMGVFQEAGINVGALLMPEDDDLYDNSYGDTFLQFELGLHKEEQPAD
ncbi:MAG: hypothetical protein K0R73_45 [Candidatus Midichloriaceae bacterium]|jgi:hypothetical protein|nr:hypothetical protein [Candidatus Midichloriaceae bacterium]